MPGLFGVIDRSAIGSALRQHELLVVARRMAAAMAFESYVRDVVSCPTVGAVVGHVGFATPVSWLPAAGREMPVVVTAGERAGFRQQSRPLAAGPAATRDACSTEAIVRDVAGTCAGFVADPRTGDAVLFNDRYGRERVFLHVDGPVTYFASEAKAILAVAPRTRAFDPAGLAELMACGCTIGARSLFRDVEVLAPGTIVTFSGAGVRRRRAGAAAELERLEPVSERAFVEGFSASLRAAVTRAVSDSAPVAVSLTGGLDSRMIMASLDAPLGSVPCYTFGSMYRTTGDVAVASAVARRCGQPHRVLELGPEFLARVRETHEQSVYISDGHLGLSGAAELDVNRQARQVAPTRMTGNWGGELMRGVRAFKFAPPRGAFLAPDFAADMAASAQAFAQAPAHPISAALFDQIPSQGYGRYAVERSQVTMRSPFLDDDVVQWLYRAPASVRNADGGAASVIGRRPELLSIPTDAGLLGSRPSALRRAWRKGLVKAEYMTSHGAPHWLAQLAASLPAPLLETRFLGVDKFQHFRFWTRRLLADFVRDVLVRNRDADLGAWFDTAKVDRMVDAHIAGRANYTAEIDHLLTVATVQKVLFRRFATLS